MDTEKTRPSARAVVARRLRRNLEELTEESRQGERDFVHHVVEFLARGMIAGGTVGVVATRWRLPSAVVWLLVLLAIAAFQWTQARREIGED